MEGEMCPKKQHLMQFNKQFSFLSPDCLTWVPMPKHSSFLSQWMLHPVSLTTTLPPQTLTPLQALVLFPILMLPYPGIIMDWDHVMPYLPCFPDKSLCLLIIARVKSSSSQPLRLLAMSVRDQTDRQVTFPIPNPDSPAPSTSPGPDIKGPHLLPEAA